MTCFQSSKVIKSYLLNEFSMCRAKHMSNLQICSFISIITEW
jgi:hypothetical protein